MLIHIPFTENEFRKMLVTVEQENMNLTVEAATLKAANSQQKKKVNIFLVIFLPPQRK